ncbi:hypothetical protein [Paenibacillus vulneris]|uniref:Uncharacterized protein n=1 Tax=Paenibacillus vulneris TaxID=1133364 RepID=A0ABW3UNC7_9BACL
MTTARSSGFPIEAQLVGHCWKRLQAAVAATRLLLDEVRPDDCPVAAAVGRKYKVIKKQRQSR